MKINLSTIELNKCKTLLNVKENNMAAVEFLIEYLNYHSRDIKESDIKKLSAKYSLEESFIRAMKKHMDIDQNDEEFNEINRFCDLEKVTCLDTSIFKDDSYYKNIKNITGKEDDWEFMKLSYDAYEGFVSDEIIVSQNDYSEHTPFSFFKEKFEYLAVVENGEIWMSVMPHEINTMREPIADAKGNVLVLGLGLGYYLYKVLEKPEIKTVDIIEKDPRVIKLFNKNLLAKFPHHEKIKIILDDGIKYIENSNKKYDFIFSDIWHNVGDGEELYIQIKNKEKFHPESTFSYWIEKSMLAMLRRQTLTVFEEALEGYSENDYKSSSNSNDKVINAIYNYHKQTIVNSYDDLHAILSDSYLKKMAANLELI